MFDLSSTLLHQIIMRFIKLVVDERLLAKLYASYSSFFELALTLQCKAGSKLQQKFQSLLKQYNKIRAKALYRNHLLVKAAFSNYNVLWKHFIKELIQTLRPINVFPVPGGP